MQEIIVYGILTLAVGFILHRGWQYLHGEKDTPGEACRDCATPCSLKREIQTNGSFRAKMYRKRKKNARKDCSLTKFS